MYDRSLPALVASEWWKRLHRRAPSSAAWLDRRCWHTCWWQNMLITAPCSASPRSMLVRASRLAAPHWRAGWERPASCSLRWSTLYATMFCWGKRFMPTIRRYPYLPRATGKPGLDGSGPMCVTIGPLGRTARLRYGLPTRLIARVSIRDSI